MINSFEHSIKKMTRFGDLIGGKETVVTPITTPQPVVEKPVEVEKVSEFPQIYTKQDLMKMTKITLVPPYLASIFTSKSYIFSNNGKFQESLS